ncbi:MAG: IgGFc-binding protein, partial [Prevotellaceae bacterium]|nr:IgGFc-binding protein [Prevotellaceae bacterium]
MKTITNTKKLFIALLLSLVVTTGYSQHNATEGTEFYVTFVNNNNLSASTPGLTCQIRYVVTEACTITAQYGDGSYLENNAVYAPGVYTLETDKSKSYYMGASGTSDKMIKISSTKNISVFALSMSVFSSDATTILPITTLGNKYTILSNIDMPNYGGHIAVIAPTPGTTFTIRRPDNTAVLSNQNIAAYNQPYFYFEDGSNQDFTGYTVESNHNVAVFSTKICGNPAPGGGCDHNFEQMFPANTAGKEYLLWSMSPIYQSSNPAGYDSYRVVALENSTTITRRIGAATTTILLNENEASSITLTPSKVTNDPYAHNSSGVIQFTSNNPFLVEHILGHAPCVKWISPVEQRVTSAVLTPFIPIGNSVIEYHQLHVMIPSGSQGFFTMKETRGGISQNVDLTFYTNITNQYYTIAYKEYAKFDDVLIELSNPAGLIAYMAGYGQAESYLFTAGVSAFNLQTYYTITTKTTPFSDVYYTDTEENTHTFVSSDNITLKRTIEKPF